MGNPINSGTGNKAQAETDYSEAGAFPLHLTRYYNSQANSANSFGYNWSALPTIRVADANNLTVIRSDQKAINYVLAGSAWTADADITDTLVSTAGGFRVTTNTGGQEDYDVTGKLLSIADRAGRVQTLSYDTAGKLASITDALGRSLTFTYDTANRISSMTDPAGGIYTYAYDAAGNLTTATYPDGASKIYHYEDHNFPNALTGISDENSHRYATYAYDAQGRAIFSEHADGAERVSLAYNPDGSTSVTDALGAVRTFGFQTILGVVKSIGQSQPGGSGCSPASSTTTYDANGNVASRDDFNGHRTRYWHDLARNLETTRTEGLAHVNGAEQAQPETRTRTTAWHSTLHLPIEERLYTGGANSAGDPAGTLITTTTYTYDPAGNLASRSHKDAATGKTRTWRTAYTYHASVPGVLVQKIENGPRTDVADLTTTDYYAPDENCVGGHFGCRGQVRQITNALGHITRIARYSAHGQPEEIIDPNGLVTTLTYDARQRLLSRSAGTETSGYAFDAAGQLIKLTQPDGSFIGFTYDPAHRLAQIADTLGNRLAYTLDAMGNRIKEDVFDPANTLAQTRQREFDALNRLSKDIGAQSQTTRYEYDTQGNLKRSTDPLLHATGNSYDALDRLIQINDSAGGQTRQTQDVLDRIVSVTDPKGIVTTFNFNGLGDMTSEASVDRGTTHYTYDSAGNLKARTDARGVKHTYSYDALNRPTRRVHTTVTGIPGATALTWSYDAGANGIGRLTGMADETGNTAYTYDPHGRLLSKAQTAKLGTASLTHTLAYGYDPAGRLTQQTYPSGVQIATTYGSTGRPIEIRINGTVLISDIVYQPFGAPKAWTWGNGQSYSRDFDADGRVNQYPVGGNSRALVYDPASRITQITHAANHALDHAYGYDALDHLVSEIDNHGTTLWTYDLNGNRLISQPGSTSYAYTYLTDSNRLQSVDGPTSKTYGYDATGNATTDGPTAYTFNAAGRLTKVVRSGKTNQYKHNADGERVIKTGAYLSNGPYRFIHDPQGRLIGEYDKNNLPRQETVWLEETPIAVLKLDPTGQTQVHYVHADHLDTPRAILDTQNRVVWQWHSDAFGQGLPGEDPDVDGKKFQYNPRFPGQYYDKETGLHYNYFRDYDPGMGRYIESDPIGLAGGFNLYAYVGGNPLNSVDPYGLAKVSGQWCGSNWTGGVAQPYEPLNKDIYDPPNGQVDACCMSHDICYSDCRNKFPCDSALRLSCMKRCNKVLKNCADKAGSFLIPFAMNFPPAKEPNSCGCQIGK